MGDLTVGHVGDLAANTARVDATKSGMTQTLGSATSLGSLQVLTSPSFRMCVSLALAPPLPWYLAFI